MLIELILISTGTVLVGTIGVVALTALFNYRAHQFFKLKSPKLPVLPNPGLFSGHANELWLDKRNWQLIDDYHKKYGKTFGSYYARKPFVSTVDLNLIKTFVFDEPNEHPNRTILDVPFNEAEVDSLFFAEDDQWRRIRRITAPAFSSHKIKSPNVQEEMNNVINRFIECIEKRLERAKQEHGEDFIVEDLEDLGHRYILDLVFTCFYKQDNIIDFHSDKDFWVDLINTNGRQLVGTFTKLCIIFPIFKPIIHWLMLRFHPNGFATHAIMNFIKSQTKLNFEAKKQLGEAMKLDKTGKFDADSFTLKDGTQFKRNMIDHVIDQFREGKLTNTEYFDTLFFLFLAANKTSSDALSKLLYHLAIHQDVQTTLREKLLSEGIETEYLQWVMNESMRLYPPAPFGCSRTITRDIQTESGLIPANSYVFTPTYTIHRLPEYWGPDAHEFKPERWKDAKNFHPAQFMPFGAGKRICPGKEFATQGVKRLINIILSRYKLEKSAKTTESLLFEAPMFIFTVFDFPTNIKVSRVNTC